MRAIGEEGKSWEHIFQSRGEICYGFICNVGKLIHYNVKASQSPLTN